MNVIAGTQREVVSWYLPHKMVRREGFETDRSLYVKFHTECLAEMTIQVSSSAVGCCQDHLALRYMVPKMPPSAESASSWPRGKPSA